MPSLFPCPNSDCTYQFDADQLPAAAMVTCPICHKRFPYRAAPRRSAQPVNEQDDDSDWTDSPDKPAPRVNRLINPRYAPKSNKTQLYVMLLAGGAVILTLAFIVVKMAREKPFSAKARNIEEDFDTYNFKMETPGAGWSLDDSARSSLGVHCFVYRKDDGSAYAALDVQEFFNKEKQPRSPSPKEVLSETKRLLQSKFKEMSFEPLGKVQLGGRPGAAISFQGELDRDIYVGEAYMTDFRGIGYSFITYSRQDAWDRVRGDLDKIRSKFQIGDGRKDWKGKSPTQFFYVPAGNYQLEDEEGVWQQGKVAEDDKGGKTSLDPKKDWIISEDSIKGTDPNATILLRAKYPIADPRRRKNLIPEANAIVMVMDKPEGDAVEAAKAYVKNRVTQEEGADNVTFTDAKPPDKTDDLPANWSQLARFSSKNSQSRDARKFFVVNAIVIDNKMVMVETRCSETHSEDMEPFMIRLAASLKERK